MKYLKERDFVERSYFHILEHYLSKAVRTSEENHNKGEQEVVTDIGLSIKKYLISELKIYFPSDNILSEEVDSDNELNGRTWAIDPIDGTINFSKGSFLFGFQIAL
ncbi:MAG: inositol monophosphatase family protein, partial [Clostridia bacterium]